MSSQPYDDSPEKRYVCLHRAIEQGCATDEIWEELSNVCHRLGYMSESLRCAREIIGDPERARVEQRLARRGVTMESVGLNVEQVAEKDKDESAAPPTWRQGTSLRESQVREEVVDSVAYLFLEHLPFVLMTITLIFPLIVGLGGTLTAGTSAWVFPALALVPVLCIAGVIGALLHRIVADTARGFTEAPSISDLPKQSRRAMMFLRDCGVAGALLLMPGVLACRFLGTIGLPVLIVSAALFPLAVAICQTRGDMRGLHPKVLLPAAFTAGISGIIAVGAVWLSFVPAMCALWLSEGSALFLRMSMVGPLAIIPLFMSARLIGRILYLNRDKMESLIWTTKPRFCEDDANIQTYDSQIAESQRTTRVRTSPAQSAPKPRQRAVAPDNQPAPRRRTGRTVAPLHPETVSRKPRTTNVEDVPAALTGLEGLEGLGFEVFVGEDRVTAGASSRGER